MIDSKQSLPQDKEALTIELVAKAEAMIPAIRERALTDEKNRVVSPDTIREMEEARLFELLVPKAYGGHGLGLDALYKIVRVLARGDASTSWIAAFLMQHNWWACRLPVEAQKEMFANRTHVKMATANSVTAKGVRTAGGYQVTGRYPYSSGIRQANYCLYPFLLIENGEPAGPPMMALVPIEDVQVIDDWHMSGMSATSSCSGVLKDVFIPEHRTMSTVNFWGSDHFARHHEEPIYKARLLESLAPQMSALAIGSAEAMIEWSRERLSTSAPFGTKRLNRTTGQIRWGQAHEKIRMATLLHEESARFCVAKEQSGEPWTMEEVGQSELDSTTILHTCKEALQMLLDGSGSSAFNDEVPLQRYVRDLHMLGTHVLAGDYDVLAERGIRTLLGLGRNEIDPPFIP